MVLLVHSFPPAEKTREHLACSKCGATTEVKCDCGVDYKHMRASELAKKAIMENPEKSDRAIAAEIGVSDRTVNRARETTATNVAVAKRIGMDGKRRVSRAKAVALPNGFRTVSDAVRAIIDLQFKGGIGNAEACKQIGLTENTYRLGRDIVLLSECSDLDDRDARIVKKALSLLDERGQVSFAASLVKPIADKLWGKKSHRFRANGGQMNKQREGFLSSISFLHATCVNAADIHIPYLISQDRESILNELREAETSLYLLRTRINGSK